MMVYCNNQCYCYWTWEQCFLSFLLNSDKPSYLFHFHILCCWALWAHLGHFSLLLTVSMGLILKSLPSNIQNHRLLLELLQFKGTSELCILLFYLRALIIWSVIVQIYAVGMITESSDSLCIIPHRLPRHRSKVWCMTENQNEGRTQMSYSGNLVA